MIDNYDSFTYNLVQALAAAGANVRVLRMTPSTAPAWRRWPPIPRRICAASWSRPVPAIQTRPESSMDAVRVALDREIPLLGVCLGMQSMPPLSARRSAAPRPSSTARRPVSATTGRGCSPGCRTRSCGAVPLSQRGVGDPASGRDRHGPHRGRLRGHGHSSPQCPIEGVQFHPESVLTPEGPHLLANFLRLAREGEATILDHASGSFALVGYAKASMGIEKSERAEKAAEAAAAGRVEVVR